MWAFRDKAWRTLGSSAVLLALAVVAVAQMDGWNRPVDGVAYEEDADTTVVTLDITTSSTGDSTTTTEPEPFVYRMGVLRGITTDNFWAFYGADPSVWNAYVLGPTKPALLTYDPVDASLKPELAVEIPTPKLDATGWHVDVTLDGRAKWSDGVPITASDIVFTFETVRRLGLEGSWAEAFPPTIGEMRAEGPNKLRIELTERPTLEVWPHGAGLAPVMAEHVWSEVAADITADELYELSGADDVGGGPLALATVEDGLITSIANPGYWRQTAPDVVEYHVFADETEAITALANGDIDSVLTPKGLTEADLEPVASDPGVAIETSPANGVRYLGFNLEREPMSDPAFRQALALLLDREALASTITGGAAVAYNFVSPDNTQWFDAEAADSIASPYRRSLEHRLEQALNALKEAGYTWSSEPTLGEDNEMVAGTALRVGGMEPAPLTILTPGDAYDPARRLYAAELARTLGWLGWDARPVETDFDTVVDLAFSPNENGERTYDMYLLGWTLGSPSLPGYYRPLFAAGSVMNSTGYRSETFARQLDAYENAYTLEQARGALWSMEATLAQDLPYLLLYTSQITEAYRADRVTYGATGTLGGLQGRLGGIGDVSPARP